MFIYDIQILKTYVYTRTRIHDNTRIYYIIINSIYMHVCVICTSLSVCQFAAIERDYYYILAANASVSLALARSPHAIERDYY